MKLPSMVFVSNRNITWIDLSYNKICTLSDEIFRPLLKIQSLSLMQNRLQSINFTLPTSLKYVNFVSNLINSIKENLFSGMTEVELLSLDNNMLTSLPSALFSTLHKMKRLSLKNNTLQSLNISLPASLEYLDLSFNTMTFLDESLFSNMHQLEVLKLDNNNLSSISSQLFTTNNSLKEINLMDNKISLIGNVTLSVLLNKIYSLNLQNNKLQSLNFTLPPFLKHIDISFNLLSSINENSFPEEIERISLVYNSLITVPPQLLHQLQGLKEINLSSNKITLLPKQIFAFNINLELLYLDYNKLTVVNFELPQSLISINLSGNLIHLIQDNVFHGLKALQQLYLHHNLLNSTAYKTFIISDLQNLVSLDISYNYFNTIDVADVKKHLSKLYYLSLEGNKFECSYLTSIIIQLRNSSIFISRERQLKEIACNTTSQKGKHSDDEVKTLKTNAVDIKEILKEFVIQLQANRSSSNIEKLEPILQKITQNLQQISNDCEAKLHKILENLRIKGRNELRGTGNISFSIEATRAPLKLNETESLILKIINLEAQYNNLYNFFLAAILFAIFITISLILFIFTLYAKLRKSHNSANITQLNSFHSEL